MGITNKQFQGFIQLTLAQINKALEISPDNEELIELKNSNCSEGAVARCFL